jgi:hypothetical protein
MFWPENSSFFVISAAEVFLQPDVKDAAAQEPADAVDENSHTGIYFAIRWRQASAISANICGRSRVSFHPG